ncbi:hypothetical protein ACWEOE_10680 [Amycolatopsis sp. NPDC004368]
MSKADDILRDELDPEDLDPSPRGGKNGRNTEKKDPVRFVERLGQRLGFLGLVVVTALSALAGCAEGALPSGPPEPARAPRPPADKLDAMFAAWRADIDSVPFRWEVA